jgi:(p)ppGpp synthase/HD superfamily hydrolase
MTALGPDFDKALAYAAEAHREQLRKATTIPYLAHLLAVTAIVLEAGGDEVQAIGALLHDVVEDQGGSTRLADVRSRFGERVARIVKECSDTDVVPKPPWRARKEAYIAGLAHHDKEVLLVSLADKLHNARSLRSDLRMHGEEVWNRFHGGKDGELWYYRALADQFAVLLPGPLAADLADTVGEIERIAHEPQTAG